MVIFTSYVFVTPWHVYEASFNAYAKPSGNIKIKNSNHKPLAKLNRRHSTDNRTKTSA